MKKNSKETHFWFSALKQLWALIKFPLQGVLLATFLAGLFTMYSDNQDFLKFSIDRSLMGFQDQGIECEKLGIAEAGLADPFILDVYQREISDLADDAHTAQYSGSAISIKAIKARIQVIQDSLGKLQDSNAEAIRKFSDCEISMSQKGSTAAALLGLSEQQFCPFTGQYEFQLKQVNDDTVKTAGKRFHALIESQDYPSSQWEALDDSIFYLGQELNDYRALTKMEMQEVGLTNSYFKQLNAILLNQFALIHSQTLFKTLKTLLFANQAKEKALQTGLNQQLSHFSTNDFNQCMPKS